MIVFEDRTALGAPDQVKRTFSGRQEISQEAGELLARVKEAESAKDPEKRYAELAILTATGRPRQPTSTSALCRSVVEVSGRAWLTDLPIDAEYGRDRATCFGRALSLAEARITPEF